MSCPNCSHTMESVGGGIFWCPRCGTQKGDGGNVWTPKLVDRCREYERTVLSVDDDPVGVEAWHRLGIEESIRPESERTTGA